jgi:hypothetical protein
MFPAKRYGRSQKEGLTRSKYAVIRLIGIQYFTFLKIHMIPKNLNDITEADFLDLISNSVPEGRTIEYKRDLPGNADKDKKEFLADVSSFTNASGGDLLYGIDAKDGIPISVNGLEIDSDKEILRLEAIIRSGIEPRIPFVIQPIRLSNSKFVLVIRVNKSWISPHRVVFQSNDKFYSRGSNGKYSLSVDELRIVFNFSETITERIRKFRETRIANIVADETPVTLLRRNDLPINSLHIIPISAFNPAQIHNIKTIDSCSFCLKPISSGQSINQKYNLDGRVDYSVAGGNDETWSYVQIFRNGIIESVWQSVPYANAIEKQIIEVMPTYLKFLEKLEAGMPLLIFLTITNIKGLSLHPPSHYDLSLDIMRKVDRDILIIPEVLIDSYDVSIPQVLKPCFDSMWNAGGFQCSPNYNEQGQWQPGK